MAPEVLLPGPQLEDLPEQDERRDDGGGLEVDVDRAVHAERVGEDARARRWRPR